RCSTIFRSAQISAPALEIMSEFKHEFWKQPKATAELQSKFWSLARDNNSIFAMMMLVSSLRFSDDIDCDKFIELLQLCWNSRIPILRMEIMELAHSVAHRLSRNYSERVPEITAQLQKCLSDHNPIMNSLVFEALAGYEDYQRPVDMQQALS